MVKVKEIRKIEPDIKEIEKRVESIDDEFEEDEEIEHSPVSFSTRRPTKTSTLDATESRQETFEERQGRISKEDREEINFRPSYLSGGNPYKSNAYTPVGAAESGAAKETRDLGDRGLDTRELRDNRTQMSAGERRGEADYAGAGHSEQDKRDRKRNLM